MNTAAPTLEILEDRLLLSDQAIPGGFLLANPGAITNTKVVGYVPAQIRHAYGFDQVPSLVANGYNTAGQGQVIAIVDAYDDPHIASDLHVFDQQFGIPNPTFIKVNQSGSRNGPWPTVNSSWAGEISIDVEWAHAIAPAATLLLVEANSTNLSDMMTAVDTARSWSGVSVLSMSWGYSEGRQELSYDAHMVTPAGHTPITFTAATLDNGSRFGLYWPAVSPDVLAVGGTSLKLNADNSYGSESGWSSSTGGISRYEPQPGWQGLLTTSAWRTNPDVSYHADYSTTGFAVYDTVPSAGQTGWFNAGGDSEGAPQWGALVAIADQVRGSALDGPSQTLPALYNLAKQNYGQYFHDIVTGSNGRYAAGPGYDLVTGIGSPRADQLVQGLASWTGPPAPSAPPPGASSTGAGQGSAAGLLEPAAAVVGSAPDRPVSEATLAALAVRPAVDAFFMGQPVSSGASRPPVLAPVPAPRQIALPAMNEAGSANSDLFRVGDGDPGSAPAASGQEGADPTAALWAIA
jgi:subtilase family serine protease